MIIRKLSTATYKFRLLSENEFDILYTHNKFNIMNT